MTKRGEAGLPGGDELGAVVAGGTMFEDDLLMKAATVTGNGDNSFF